ncbi:hypothetical protein N7467_008282 [Penicillium canescens]|nr:hypothetical protein N7467_008282 [Penicillium canescens]
MATGFEAVGLALAIFPILVEALKFYANERGTVKDFFRYQRLLKRIGRDLSREKTIFYNTCQRFIQDIASQCGIPDQDVLEMMHNLDDPRWCNGIFDREQILSGSKDIVSA